MLRLMISLTLGLAILFPSTAAFALTAYPDDVGTSFLFQNMEEATNTAGDPDPIFGAPLVVGDALVFTPTSFISTATAGSGDQTAGTFKFDIVSSDKDSIAVESLILQELGDFSLTGVGGVGTNASALAGVFIVVTEVNIGGVIQAPGVLDLLALNVLTQGTDFVSFDTTIQADDWSLLVNIDVQSALDSIYGVDGAFATEVSVVWNNDLTTNSQANSTSLIQKKIGVPAVTIEVIPEPSVALLVGLGLLGLSNRRRR